jgi:hypothetical protein
VKINLRRHRAKKSESSRSVITDAPPLARHTQRWDATAPHQVKTAHKPPRAAVACGASARTRASRAKCGQRKQHRCAARAGVPRPQSRRGCKTRTSAALAPRARPARPHVASLLRRRRRLARTTNARRRAVRLPLHAAARASSHRRRRDAARCAPHACAAGAACARRSGAVALASCSVEADALTHRRIRNRELMTWHLLMRASSSQRASPWVAATTRPSRTASPAGAQRGRKAARAGGAFLAPHALSNTPPHVRAPTAPSARGAQGAIPAEPGEVVRGAARAAAAAAQRRGAERCAACLTLLICVRAAPLLAAAGAPLRAA